MNLTIETWIGFLIIAFCVASGLGSIHFLINGLKENKIIHTALAGNVLIVVSTISGLCYAMMV